jgi:hypothetical protein
MRRSDDRCQQLEQCTKLHRKKFQLPPLFSGCDGEEWLGRPLYAVGNTTSIPGYFISQPVYASAAQRGHSAPVGVITVKISLDEFQKSWRSNNEPIALTGSQWRDIFK